MNWRNKENGMQNLYMCSANLLQQGHEWRGEFGCCGQQQGDDELTVGLWI